MSCSSMVSTTNLMVTGTLQAFVMVFFFNVGVRELEVGMLLYWNPGETYIHRFLHSVKIDLCISAIAA